MQTTVTHEGSLPMRLIPLLLDRYHRDKLLPWQPYGAEAPPRAQIVPLYDGRRQGTGPAAALLKYAPGTRITQHLHGGFELTFVLDGELVDDSGRHGPGTLQLYPPGSAHSLTSDAGCTLLVVWEQPTVRLS